MTVFWRCTFLLCFLPREILRFESLLFLQNLSQILVQEKQAQSPPSILPSFPSSLPPVKKKKKIIKKFKENLTKCVEPDFLHLGTSQFDSKTSADLTRLGPWNSQAGRSCCSCFSLLPTSLHPLFPPRLPVNTSFTIWCSLVPWVSYSCQLVEKGLKIWAVSRWGITPVWWGVGRKLRYSFYAILFPLKEKEGVT